MFGSIVRSGLLLIAGSFLFVALSMAGNPLLSQQQQLAPAESTNPHWASVILTWFPAVVLASVAAILIGGAIARREL